MFADVPNIELLKPFSMEISPYETFVKIFMKLDFSLTFLHQILMHVAGSLDIWTFRELNQNCLTQSRMALTSLRKVYS